MKKCLFCKSEDITRYVVYKRDYAPCPNCGYKRINVSQNSYNEENDPTCYKCKTSAPHKVWPKLSPDRYYYICNNCNAKVYEKDK